jgi:hypothetical protein
MPVMIKLLSQDRPVLLRPSAHLGDFANKLAAILTEPKTGLSVPAVILTVRRG